MKQENQCNEPNKSKFLRLRRVIVVYVFYIHTTINVNCRHWVNLDCGLSDWKILFIMLMNQWDKSNKSPQSISVAESGKGSQMPIYLVLWSDTLLSQIPLGNNRFCFTIIDWNYILSLVKKWSMVDQCMHDKIRVGLLYFRTNFALDILYELVVNCSHLA